MEEIQELKKLLAVPKDIAIISHRNPDGDAIGSSLGLYHYLIQQGHTVRVMFPSEYPRFVAWLPSVEDCAIYDLEPQWCKTFVERAHIIFCLDFNSLDRIDALGEVVEDSGAFKALIDHHLYPDMIVDFMLSDTTASSTSELVYDFIAKLGDAKKLNKEIATCLYVGILTDTGSFKYSISPKLFRIVAELHEMNIPNEMIQNELFNSLPEKNLRLLGYCLFRNMEIIDEYRTGIISLSREDYDRFDIQRGDTEGIVNYLLMLKNVTFAVLITEQPKIIKFSFRSKGNFSVQAIASQHFNGGGHLNASGGFMYGTLKAAVQKIKEILPSQKQFLDKEI